MHGLILNETTLIPRKPNVPLQQDSLLGDDRTSTVELILILIYLKIALGKFSANQEVFKNHNQKRDLLQPLAQLCSVGSP